MVKQGTTKLVYKKQLKAQKGALQSALATRLGRCQVATLQHHHKLCPLGKGIKVRHHEHTSLNALSNRLDATLSDSSDG